MMRLEKIVDSIINLHKKVLPVSQKSIKVSYQQTFEGFSNTCKHVNMGNFYEYMTQGLWGGVLQNRLLLENGEKVLSEDSNDICSLVKPDCINKKKKQVGESKAVKSGESANLLDAQLDRYKLLQFHRRDTQIYFAIYRHSIQKIMSFNGDVNELFDKLSGATYHSVVLPFSLILELQKTSNQNLVYRYDGEGFYHCTCVKSPTLNRFLTEPEKVIDELELNKDDFLIKRYLSPKNFYIGGKKINPFPILRIFDANHSKWIKNFQFEIKDSEEGLQEDYNCWEFDKKISIDGIDLKEYNPQEDGCSELSGESLEIPLSEDEVPF